jgi:hypothetical protein
VIHTDGRWYVIGHCLTRRAMRTFRLDRAMDVEVCTATFRRPKDFDAHRYLREHMPFIQSDYQIDVWIDMPIEEAERIFSAWRIATEGQDGGTRLRCSRDGLELFAAMLLSVDRRIVVHTPAELSEAFRRLARRAAQAAEESSSSTNAWRIGSITSRPGEESRRSSLSFSLPNAQAATQLFTSDVVLRCAGLTIWTSILMVWSYSRAGSDGLWFLTKTSFYSDGK